MPLQEFLRDTPIVTRNFLILSVLLTILCSIDIVPHVRLLFNTKLILQKYQVWRLFTNFLYFGPFGIHTCFELLIFYRYSTRLEAHNFRGRSIDYLYFILVGCTMLTIAAPFCGMFMMSSSLSFMLLYLWSRRKSGMQMWILGLRLTAPYVPWFFMFINFVMEVSLINDLMGVVVGHIYFYFEDIYPKLPHSRGYRLFRTPKIFERIAEAVGISNATNHVQAQWQQDEAEFIF
mmetsp:Transcript_40039/g.45721  ORF Transcript_40039/g.45721 Transcript_40039/m.45721 type:complete len:233 (+) Transcript_40039:97-795(+)